MGDLGSVPGLGRFPGGGHGNPLQYSCLENPHEQGGLVGHSPWGLRVMESQTQLSGTAQDTGWGSVWSKVHRKLVAGPGLEPSSLLRSDSGHDRDMMLSSWVGPRKRSRKTECCFLARAFF